MWTWLILDKTHGLNENICIYTPTICLPSRILISFKFTHRLKGSSDTLHTSGQTWSTSELISNMRIVQAHWQQLGLSRNNKHIPRVPGTFQQHPMQWLICQKQRSKYAAITSWSGTGNTWRRSLGACCRGTALIRQWAASSGPWCIWNSWSFNERRKVHRTYSKGFLKYPGSSNILHMSGQTWSTFELISNVRIMQAHYCIRHLNSLKLERFFGGFGWN